MYDILFSKKAVAYLDKLEKKQRARILRAVERLKIRPEAHLVRLVDEAAYKFRVGDYRLIIDIEQAELRILVIKIGHRRNIYKK